MRCCDKIMKKNWRDSNFFFSLEQTLNRCSQMWEAWNACVSNFIASKMHQHCVTIVCRILLRTSVLEQKTCHVEVNFPLLLPLMLHNTHHTRHVAHCKKADILRFPTMCCMSWVGPIKLDVVRRNESILH